MKHEQLDILITNPLIRIDDFGHDIKTHPHRAEIEKNERVIANTHRKLLAWYQIEDRQAKREQLLRFDRAEVDTFLSRFNMESKSPLFFVKKNELEEFCNIIKENNPPAARDIKNAFMGVSEGIYSGGVDCCIVMLPNNLENTPLVRLEMQRKAAHEIIHSTEKAEHKAVNGKQHFESVLANTFSYFEEGFTQFLSALYDQQLFEKEDFRGFKPSVNGIRNSNSHLDTIIQGYRENYLWSEIDVRNGNSRAAVNYYNLTGMTFSLLNQYIGGSFFEKIRLIRQIRDRDEKVKQLRILGEGLTNIVLRDHAGNSTDLCTISKDIIQRQLMNDPQAQMRILYLVYNARNQLKEMWDSAVYPNKSIDG